MRLHKNNPGARKLKAEKKIEELKREVQGLMHARALTKKETEKRLVDHRQRTHDAYVERNEAWRTIDQMKKELANLREELAAAQQDLNLHIETYNVQLGELRVMQEQLQASERELRTLQDQQVDYDDNKSTYHHLEQELATAQYEAHHFKTLADYLLKRAYQSG